MKKRRNDTYKKVILNQPIQSMQNDWIGVSTYVNNLETAIKQGAEIVGVTSDFGTGKSSLLSLYRAKIKRRAKKFLYTINMWEVLNQEGEDGESSSRKSVKDIHQVFLYHMVNQINANKGSYLSKRLSKNYGLFSIQSSSSIRTFMALFAIIALVIGEGFRRFSIYLPKVLNRSMLFCKVIEYVSYCVGIITMGIVLWKSDFIFSSAKSEGKRENDENIIIDYYAKEVLYRGYRRHYVFVIEDLDRTDNPQVVTDFLKELRKYYLTDYNRKKRLHRNKVTFIVCIKPEAMLNDTVQSGLYHKFFDYILNLPVVSIDNYDAILNGLLYELKDKLIDLGLVMLEDADNVSIASIKGMQWLIRGKEIDIRTVKNRLNLALTLYESLITKFSGKGISFEKCAVISYLMTEYQKDFYKLTPNMIESLINHYTQGKLTQNDIPIEEWKNVSTYFWKEIVSLIDNKLIDVNYRTYFFNYPKDSYLYDLNEMLVFNSLYYNEPPKDKEKYKIIIQQIDERTIKEAFTKLNMLDLKFPVFAIEYDESFAVMANEFENKLFQIIESLPWDSNNIKRYNYYVGKCFAYRKGVNNRQSLLHKLSIVLCENISDKTILRDIRESLCTEISNDVLMFSELYDNDNPFFSKEEVDAINDATIILQLINYDTLSADVEICFSIHELIIKENLTNQEVVKFYLEVEKRQGIEIWFDNMSSFCKNCHNIPTVFLDRFRYAIERELIERASYVDLLEAISTNTSEEINLLSDINWVQGLSQKLCLKLYDARYYVGYVCNQIIVDPTQIDFSELVIKEDIQENVQWIEENANENFMKIRKVILENKKWIREYSFLFKSPFLFINEEELALIADYQDAIFLFSLQDIQEESLQMIADFFSNVYRNQTETYKIMMYISSLEMPMAKTLFYLLNPEKFSYMRMAKARQSELNKRFYDLFQIQEYPSEAVEFMRFVNIAVPIMEKELYSSLKKDSSLCDKYVLLINDFDRISHETLKNIIAIDKKYSYSDIINEELYQRKEYEIYVISKTLRNHEFIFEKNKIEQLQNVYIKIFNQEDYEDMQNYMKDNKELMQWLVQVDAYKDAGKRIQNYAATRQSTKLLEYIMNDLTIDQIIEYLSKISGFDGRESAKFFVNWQQANKKLLVQSSIYNNCHGKLIDPGLKGTYTRKYNEARKELS